MNDKLHKLIATSLMAGTFFVSNVFANDVDETVKIIPSKTVSASRGAELSKDAAEVALLVADARDALHRKDAKDAKMYLRKALLKIKSINNLMPTQTIIDHIEIAKKHLNYESTQEVKQDLIPIAYDINRLTFALPTDDIKKHYVNLQKAVNSGNKKNIQKELATLKKAVTVSAICLPVNETETYIYKALKVLNISDYKQADAALKEAESDLVVMSVTDVQPMTNAKKSFYKAMTDYTKGEYAKAKEDLHQSELWLDRAMYTSDVKTKAEIKELKQKAEVLKENLSQNSVNAKEKIKELLAKSKALSEKIKNSMIYKYDTSKKEAKIKSDLLDAKLHLEYAEDIEQSVYGTKRDLKTELQKAKLSLKNASQYANTKTKASIKKIESDINTVAQNVKENKNSVKSKYDEIKTKIDKLISQI